MPKLAIPNKHLDNFLLVSEIDRYIFQEPINVEDNPEAVRAFYYLVDSVFPVRFDTMPHDVLDVSVSRYVDDGVNLNIQAHHVGGEGSLSTVYTVRLSEEYFWPNDPETLQYDRVCEIELFPAQLNMRLVTDLRTEYDAIGDLVRVSGADTAYLDSHTLYDVCTKLESLPGSLGAITDN